MERPNARAALKDKRGEIAGRIDALQDQLRQALICFDHVDGTILLFDPDAVLDEIEAKAIPPRRHAFKGRGTRAILDMLRKSGAAMDSLTITPQLMEERDLNLADKKLVKKIQKHFGAALRNMRERGLVTSDEPRKGGLLAWRVAQRRS